MKKQPQNEFNAFHLFLGLLLGFLLGTTVVYWHTNRQNDRLFTETLDMVLSAFSDHNIHLESKDSTKLNTDQQDILKSLTERNTIGSSPPLNGFRIAKDKLLYTTTLTLNSPSTNQNDYIEKLESLMGRADYTPPEQTYFVEFWKSPLNSVGYKMGKNKIVLFGLTSFDMVSITNYHNKIYLRYLNDYYPLEITTSFKPLVPVNEPFFSEGLQGY